VNTNSENILWVESSSQYTNINAYILYGLLCLTIILIPVSICVIAWKYLVTKNTKYELTTERLKSYSGVLSKEINSIELYRIRDIKIEKPFSLRIFGLGNIILLSNDVTSPLFVIQGVKDCESKSNDIRVHVEKCRDAKGTKTIEME